MPTGEALKPERDPPGVLTGRTGKKEAPWVGLPRLPSFPCCDGSPTIAVSRGNHLDAAPKSPDLALSKTFKLSDEKH